MGLSKMLQWVDAELANGRNDTVHDLLSHLAGKMIEMNKVKNEEIKGFLNWLAREIGTEIENLTNKTAIKEYHEHGFIQLLEVLKKNKSKLSIDLSSRKNQELIEKHFNESASKLDPLKTRIRATDEMMDDIVYKLYGLDEDEIKIVKG